MGDLNTMATSRSEIEGKDDSFTPSNPEVLAKYQEAAKIVNVTLEGVVQQCVAGARIIDICKFGDGIITQCCAAVYQTKQKSNNKGKGAKEKPMEKGIAFPTCVSVNELICHVSPLDSSAQEFLPLNNGDLVRIDLGCHIDGYIAFGAHTIIVGAENQPTPQAPLSGPLADVFLATYYASELVTKLIQPGQTNIQVADTINRVATAFNVNVVAGSISHELQRYVVDGPKTIVIREQSEEQARQRRPESTGFELNEVYAIDLAFSSGEGRPKESNFRTTVFKRNVDVNYNLKMRASRTLISQIGQKYSTLPFCLRNFDNENQARLGVSECITHDLVQPFPVLATKQGEHVVHMKFTVLVLPSGTVKVTGLSFQPECFATDKCLPQDILDTLASSTNSESKVESK